MGKKLKILFAASEADPFVKTGGLADVAGSLPQAIKKQGHDMRLVIPEYRQIPAEYKEKMEPVCHFRTKLAWRDTYVGINKLEYDGITVYFVDNKYYFDRDSLYENEDNFEQFAFFSQAVLDMLPVIDFKPDIIHANDWQTGPLPLLFADRYRQQDFYSDIKTVFTIHNLRYQGEFGRELTSDLLSLPPHHWYSGNIRHNGLLNYMKSGIMYADHITTVSKTYAEEIRTEYFGEGLDYALRLRADDLSGIINGISYEKFNPEADSEIYVNYSSSDISGKDENKNRLQQEMGLEVNADIPIISIISRLVDQKGLDLVKGVFQELMDLNIQMIILGTGDKKYEDFFHSQSERYAGKLAVNIFYDSELAKKIYAGSDIFLMPSKYEPCGLSQLISFRYGTIPIVRETGGLNDTVDSYSEETGEGTGFSFNNYNAHDMLYTVQRAVSFYHRTDIWHKLIRRVMDMNYSWEHSAEEYDDLYAELSSGNDSEEEESGSVKASEKSEEGAGESGMKEPVEEDWSDEEEAAPVRASRKSHEKRAETRENNKKKEIEFNSGAEEESGMRESFEHKKELEDDEAAFVKAHEEKEEDFDEKDEAAFVKSAKKSKHSKKGKKKDKKKININKAKKEELRLLPGIGPTFADRIIAHRKKEVFTTKEEIMNVKGIGQKTYTRISDLLDL
ncbi:MULTISPECIES: glycogen synthase GlgA [unclassified Halanaerobium]|uniref:glycogen synthase GlgA n=1 Tax=unclassified Halanaerobium TaxID=2641197 RepID=UPI000DF1BFE1|nr:MULTISPECIES: glycogen synthase GlgA [unclassified Halanaerobium]RCW49856.1 starch synthase [Halanaerobium sp. MA284_MarDTE_T2]RCW88500.1 starch synthase [Halanaerobium sp. DL-01]